MRQAVATAGAGIVLILIGIAVGVGAEEGVIGGIIMGCGFSLVAIGYTGYANVFSDDD